MPDFAPGDRVRLDSLHPRMNRRLKCFLGREGRVTHVIEWSGKVGVDFARDRQEQGTCWHVAPGHLANLSRPSLDGDEPAEPAPRV